MWKLHSYVALGLLMGGMTWASDEDAFAPLRLSSALGTAVSSVAVPREDDAARGQPLPEPSLKSSRILQQPAAPSTRQRPSDLRSAWFAVSMNGVAVKEPARLMVADGSRLYASASDLQRWRVRVPEQGGLPIKDVPYYALDEMKELRYRIDEPTQSVVIDAAPQAFLPTLINSRVANFAMPDTFSSGGWFNYDVQAQTDRYATRFDGLFEAGIFNRWGVGTTRFLAQGPDSANRLVRLETSWTRDDPLNFRSTRVGDGISRPGAWGRSVRYGGLRWGTDFSTRPDFVPFPLPSLHGEATVPSTVELYVDNVLRQSRSVPYGPFTISNAPVMSGDGQVKLVVRDALGRESVVTQSYYVTQSLLQPGLEDYTYEAGFLRERFAIESNDYGNAFATATRRAGLSDRLTGETRIELQRAQQTLGAGLTSLWPKLGLLNVSGALSHSDGGAGGLISLGLERNMRRASFGVQSTLTSADFVQLGADERHPPALRTHLAHASWSYGAPGSFSLAYLEQAYRQSGRDTSTLEILSAGYSVNLRGNCYLSVFALKPLRPSDADYSVGVALTYAFGNNTTGSASAGHENRRSTSGVQVQRNLPQGDGFGYLVAATRGERSREEADLYAQAGVGAYSLQASRIDNDMAYRVGASGGVALLGSGMHLSRRIDDSFALVRVGGYPSVPVYLENQEVARTDSRGVAILPHLLPNQANAVSIQPQDLPLETQAELYRRSVTPARRGGAVVDFKVRTSRGALLTIVREDGTPLPSGAVVTLEGLPEEFPVARRGEAYVTNLAPANRARASWQGQSCRFDVALPADAGALPRLGPFQCRLSKDA